MHFVRCRTRDRRAPRLETVRVAEWLGPPRRLCGGHQCLDACRLLERRSNRGRANNNRNRELVVWQPPFLVCYSDRLRDVVSMRPGPPGQPGLLSSSATRGTPRSIHRFSLLSDKVRRPALLMTAALSAAFVQQPLRRPTDLQETTPAAVRRGGVSSTGTLTALARLSRQSDKASDVSAGR